MSSFKTSLWVFLFFRRTFWALQNPSHHNLWRTQANWAHLCWTTAGNPPPPAPAAQNTLLFLTVRTAAHWKGRVQRWSFRMKRICSLRGPVSLLQPTACSCLKWRGTRRPYGAAGSKRRRTADWPCYSRRSWTVKTLWTAGRVQPTAIRSGKNPLRLPQAQTQMKRKTQERASVHGRLRGTARDAARKPKRDCLEQ